MSLRSLLLSLLLACAAPWAAAEGYAELAAAIRAGDTAQTLALLDAGVSPNPTDGKGSAPLLLAASRGQQVVVRALLARGADANPRLAAYYNATPLMLAVNNRDLAMTKLLLEGGAQVNLVDSNGDPALNWACFYGDLPAVELLLQHGADTTLVGHGSALDVAMRRGHQPLVERLVDHLKLRRTPAPAEQRLIAALDADDAVAVQAALAAGASANTLDGTGRPVLARAARRGHTALVALLLAAGADANAADRIGFTPLFEAARDGRIDAVRELLRGGADPNRVATARGLLMTPLHAAAAATPAQPALLQLLARAGARLDARDSERATPLLWAINGDAAAAQALVELGADPDLPPQAGDSPRQIAQRREMKDLLAAMQRARPL